MKRAFDIVVSFIGLVALSPCWFWWRWRSSSTRRDRFSLNSDGSADAFGLF